MRLPGVASRETKVPGQGRGWSWRLFQNMKDIGTQEVCRNEKHCLPGLPEKTRKQDEVRQVLSRKHWMPFGLPGPQ